MKQLLVAIVLLALSTEGYAQLTCFECTNCPGDFRSEDFSSVTCSNAVRPPILPPSPPLVPPSLPTPELNLPIGPPNPPLIPAPVLPPNPPIIPVPIFPPNPPIVAPQPPAVDLPTPELNLPIAPPNPPILPPVIDFPTPELDIPIGPPSPPLVPGPLNPILPNPTFVPDPTAPTPIPPLPPGGPILPDVTLTPNLLNIAKNHQTLSRERRQTPEFQCFRMRSQVNGQEVFTRGCAVRQANNDATCRSINGGTDPAWCRICDYNNCNSANGIKLSIGTLMASIILIALRVF